MVRSNRMTLYEFNLLPEEEQFQYLWNNGKHLHNVNTGNHFAQLYAVDMFFVEVIYNHTTNKIEGLKSFLHGDIMDKYIPIIKL